MSRGLNKCFGKREKEKKKRVKGISRQNYYLKHFLKKKDSSNFTLLIGFTLGDNQELKNE